MSAFNKSRLIDFHRALLAEKGRCESYRQVLTQTVRRGNVVLDIGTGTGILAFFACQAGAKRVYAVEANEVLELAKLICLKNNFQDRIVFFNDLSHRVELPESVDVIVTDTFDSFGLNSGLLGSIIDARESVFSEKGA